MQGLIATHGSSGLVGQEAIANAKAKAVYDILDANPAIFRPVNSKEVRSRMNICFRCSDETAEKDFLAGAEARGLKGLKGHRSVVSPNIAFLGTFVDDLRVEYA